ncbi:hypothetical protein [Dokdonella sp.]|uniref:hypothetical protein n=1 Tax=Dokdonella sp. TaxID=2291710 RepID=UPI002F42AF2C
MSAHAPSPLPRDGMTPAQALAFVERHGIVLEAARRGAIPSLADAVAGETLAGTWWAHAQGKRIFAATRAVRAAADVLVCRVVDGRVSFVHARLWPALVRLADRFPRERLARLREVHGDDGRHRVEEVTFPNWLDAATLAAGRRLGEAAAREALAALPEAAA